MDLVRKQEELQREGKKLLKKIGLIEFLSKFGKPHIVGSMQSGLMIWRDIDIEVIQEDINDNEYWEVVNFLFYLKDLYHSLYIQDFRKSVNPITPKGLYIGTKIEFDQNTWKIDIWFIPPRFKNVTNYNEWIKDKLNEENRKIILEIKNKIYGNSKYRKEIFAVDIYKAVIENGVKDLEGFEKYLETQGKSLD